MEKERKLEITYTINEVMEILQLSRKTIHWYIKLGKLRGCKIGNEWRITQEQLDDFFFNTEVKKK